jgi:hypothetical protein
LAVIRLGQSRFQIMTEEEIIINKIAQDKIDFEKGVLWYDGLQEDKQKRVIEKLILFVQQSHPTKELIDIGLSNAPIKQTMTPVVIFKTQNFKTALHKIRTLPKDEWRKLFVTLLSIFKVADTRRREVWCKDGCGHEWHNLNP